MKNGEDIIQIINELCGELQSLRRRNEILEAKVDTMNLFATVLNTQPVFAPVTMQPDIIWQSQKLVEQIQESLKPQPA